MRWPALVLLPLAACTAFGGESSSSDPASGGGGPDGGDGSTTDDGGLGHGGNPGSCQAAPFGELQPVVGFEDRPVLSATFTANEDRIVWSEGAAPRLKEGTPNGGGFGDFDELTSVNSVPDPDVKLEWPTLSEDGLILYFTRTDSAFTHLERSTRSATGYGAGEVVSGPSGVPYPRGLHYAHGLQLWFYSDGGPGNTVVGYSTLDANSGALGSPELETGAKSPGGTDEYPVLSHDGLTIFWQAIASGSATKTQVMTATRTADDAAFSNVSPVPELSDVRPVFYSADGCHLYVLKVTTAGPRLLVTYRK